ncbi:PTS sugar transporter subunit IIA [Evansella halocellulosilytica]|uniref:PTS sugar transporter subunit IIA n=1 Tax=Evansella halocellulosilytica TaxID=2011013 RepID=UPI000BB8C4B8|nr:PTS glucose transporter subunit IIA [Evansella halocellulosilytica]
MFKKLLKKTSEKEIFSPIDGKVVNIEEVPDPVFSQKMMGEGVAIIPNHGVVVAPVDGKVVQVAPTKHAIGIQTDDGTELLIHVGLDTVSLNGAGFQVQVSTGDKLSVGQPLMEFDLEYIREHATDVITPVVITNSHDQDKNYSLKVTEKAKAGETVLISYRRS